MERELLLQWWQAALDDVPTCSPDDCALEARSNQWAFSLSEVQRSRVTPYAVEAFLREIILTRARWLEAHGAAPMLFYCWHDEQAGQFRFSLVSAEHGRLPFGASVRRVPDLRNVVDSWMGSASSHDIPIAECLASEFERVETTAAPWALDVWVARLP